MDSGTTENTVWRADFENDYISNRIRSFNPTEVTNSSSSEWARVGFVAVASALAGGLAAAWWYRKTLKTLRRSEETDPNPEFGISSDEAEGD